MSRRTVRFDEMIVTLRVAKEHAAIVRAVRRLRMTAGIRTEYQREREMKAKVISAYTLAIDDVLTLLAARKGKKG